MEDLKCIHRTNSYNVCNLKKIPVRRPAFVNPLVPETPEEEEIFKQGECMSYILVVCASALG